jgi:hypothetical protein
MLERGQFMKIPDKKHVNHVVKEHLETQKVACEIRERKVSLEERQFYPAHDKRTETNEYKKVRKMLCIEKDLPCLICGVKNTTLKNRDENRYGAKQMEAHHHIVEWALANAVDVDSFNRILRPNLSVRHKDEPVYQRDMTEKEIKAWIDHSPHNLWVLCDVHHRHKFLGIHAISYPIWCPQDLLKPDFEKYVREHLKSGDNG